MYFQKRGSRFPSARKFVLLDIAAPDSRLGKGRKPTGQTTNPGRLNVLTVSLSYYQGRWGEENYEINYNDLPGFSIPSTGSEENAAGIRELFFR